MDRNKNNTENSYYGDCVICGKRIESKVIFHDKITTNSGSLNVEKSKSFSRITPECSKCGSTIFCFDCMKDSICPICFEIDKEIKLEKEKLKTDFENQKIQCQKDFDDKKIQCQKELENKKHALDEKYKNKNRLYLLLIIVCILIILFMILI